MICVFEVKFFFEFGKGGVLVVFSSFRFFFYDLGSLVWVVFIYEKLWNINVLLLILL